jgi:hypothetical protein
METRVEVLADLYRGNERLRQVAYQFITGASTPEDGPAYGYALLALVEHTDALRDGLSALVQQAEAIEHLEALIDRQAATLDGLLAENDALRAKLYLQDRQRQGSEP